ncbi:hypothetical protein [Candidatus Chromulinivorax destructor]|uniref:Uncharacterized protein n=1 Tax=Candidatus Chromulinivorax destructor TaxID=2066483 RepID=A0A345ZCE1_9BACT|nr:hypothetical protein [Candidatus Chromulinivorax destructor]AXK60958.1 hypothetical protein C0J27_04460 [Candidatus Chromulinivorax destructor]
MRNFKAAAFEKKNQLEIWLHDLNLKSSDFIRLACSFGIGFLFGLIVKRWCKYIVLITIFTIILLAVLQNCAIITINITTIQKITGLQGVTNLSNLFFALVQESKKHVLIFSCSGVGFFLGFKTG